MSISEVGGVSSVAGGNYDFTSLTTKQAFDAAKDLFKRGVLSEDAAGRLESAAQGIDFMPMDRFGVASGAHTLADSTKVDWLSYFQQSSEWNHANSGTIGGESTDVLLSELKKYQSGSDLPSTKILSVLS